MTGVAVVGEGVIGTSTALAIKKTRPDINVTVFHDRPFHEICSAMPAGLFRFDNVDDRSDAKATFNWYAELCRQYPGSITGVKLLSGHIQSDSKEALEQQGVKVLGEWCHLRPARDSIRVESVEKRSKRGNSYTIVHNYGHGGHGFTLGWGTALRAAALVDKALINRAKI
ncbi:FAD dependent oxidoreductase [Oesophagostomum dentatum]|uniref:FAD dependent oxidoreductase n=1 Tax=Oesophagostomum dentatum TaxID=61180 RepID=A0A0B1TGY5_OESDE|nr:FAD dependent oxidoreductase [Oesophagostomum dentatum]